MLSGWPKSRLKWSLAMSLVRPKNTQPWSKRDTQQLRRSSTMTFTQCLISIMTHFYVADCIGHKLTWWDYTDSACTCLTVSCQSIIYLQGSISPSFLRHKYCKTEAKVHDKNAKLHFQVNVVASWALKNTNLLLSILVWLGYISISLRLSAATVLGKTAAPWEVSEHMIWRCIGNFIQASLDPTLSNMQLYLNKSSLQTYHKSGPSCFAHNCISEAELSRSNKVVF